MTTEEWRPIPGFPAYQVSDLGRVSSTKYGDVRILRGTVGGNGYRSVQLYPDGARPVQRTVHSLVAEVFHGPKPSEHHEVRHLNGNRLDCRATNLQWGTRSENMQDAVSHGTHAWARRTHCKYGHPFDGVTGKQRICRTCRREASRRYERDTRAKRAS